MSAVAQAERLALHPAFGRDERPARPPVPMRTREPRVPSLAAAAFGDDSTLINTR
jgi:hypothetical protein